MPSIDGYFSENLVNVVIVTIAYDLPSYSVWRMGVFFSTDKTTGPSLGIDLEKRYTCDLWAHQRHNCAFLKFYVPQINLIKVQLICITFCLMW